MSALNTIARILGPHYTFDDNVGFANQQAGDRPCFGCLAHIHKDTRLVCVAGTNDAICVHCNHYAQRCGAVSSPSRSIGFVSLTSSPDSR